MRVDINCDMGESFGRWELGDDPAVLPFVSSANIACGAHPGFADIAGFGRREIPISGAEARDLVLWQLGALAAIARSEGVRLRHVKAHGALYNMAGLAAAVAEFDPSLIFFGLAGSGMLAAGRSAGLEHRRRDEVHHVGSPASEMVARKPQGVTSKASSIHPSVDPQLDVHTAARRHARSGSRRRCSRSAPSWRFSPPDTSAASAR